MQVTTYPDVAAWLQAAQPFLEADEPLNNLVLGTALRLRARHPPIPYCATVDDAGDLLIVALLMSDELLLTGRHPAMPAAIASLVQDLAHLRQAVPRVRGPRPLARRFAERWAAVIGVAPTLEMCSQAWVLEQVIAPCGRDGRLRLARAEDTPRVTAWLGAFAAEALGIDAPPEAVAADAHRRIAAQEIFLWDVGDPVAMAGTTRPTPHGIGINAVYTPPPQRGRGYATACVAAVSQRMLDGGRQFCTLFTDQGNPVSAAIYEKIGYRPVAKFEEYHFIQD